ncbi:MULTISPECIES: transporter [Cupriavidus]
MPQRADDSAPPTPRRRSSAAWLAIAALALIRPAFGAHPLEAEDTSTQGKGNIELENGLSWLRADGATVFTYQPQVSYGLTPTLDLLVQPSWVRGFDPDGARTRGLGDTNIDAKWRFYGSAPWAFGTRLGVTAPTSQHGLGLPHDKVSAHALMLATYDAAPFTFHGNLGLARNPEDGGTRRWEKRVAAAVMWAANEHLILTAEAVAVTDPSPASGAWPVTLLAGVIYTVVPGLDIDIGYQSTMRARVPSHEWRLGFTYRFAP